MEDCAEFWETETFVSKANKDLVRLAVANRVLGSGMSGGL